MPSFTLASALLSLAALAAAQPGRYGCTNADGNGPDQSICDTLVGTGVEDGNSGVFKSFGYVPQNSQCIQDAATGEYFCGYAGAA